MQTDRRTAPRLVSKDKHERGMGGPSMACGTPQASTKVAWVSNPWLVVLNKRRPSGMGILPMACGTPRASAVLGRHQQERSVLLLRGCLVAEYR